MKIPSRPVLTEQTVMKGQKGQILTLTSLLLVVVVFPLGCAAAVRL